jgi:ketosteroid isomerase-like protein
MSCENVDFLRQGYEALQRGDMETFKALSRERLDPEFAFHHVWDGRVFTGFEGTMEWIGDTRETWEDYSQELTEIIDWARTWSSCCAYRRAAVAAACRLPKSSRSSGRRRQGGGWPTIRLRNFATSAW